MQKEFQYESVATLFYNFKRILPEIWVLFNQLYISFSIYALNYMYIMLQMGMDGVKVGN